VATTQRTGRPEPDVLVRQIDAYLAALRAGRPARPAEIPVAEQIAAALRRAVAETARASAADRARVRAAVRYFVSRRAWHSAAGRLGTGSRPRRPIRVVNDILSDLGRSDLAVPEPPLDQRSA